MERREGYYDYMLRRYREEDSKNKMRRSKFTDELGEGISSPDSVYRREIKLLNESYYQSLIRIKELNEEIQKLKDKVEALENANLHNY